MKKFLVISVFFILIFISTFTVSYASNSTLSEVTNNLNSFIQNTQQYIHIYSCTATNTENTLNINLIDKLNEPKVTESYEYSLSNNILSRTTSTDNYYETTAFMLLLDCIGQVHGYLPGDLYCTLKFDQMSDYTLEKDGFSVKTLENETYELKADISKTIDMSNLYFEESDLGDFGKITDSAFFLQKGFLEIGQLPSWNTDTEFSFFIAERNNLTENTYKSLLTIINRIFDNSENVLNYFKENFPNLNVGTREFAGFKITVAPTAEEADTEYWLLNYDMAYKVVNISINIDVVNELVTKKEDNTQNNTSLAQNESNNYVDYETNEQTTVNEFKNSITKLPQTGKFFNLKDCLIILAIFSTILLIFVIIKDINYKNIIKK